MKRKSFFRMVGLLLAAAFLLCACSDSETESGSSASDLPEIIIGTNNYEPYSDLSTVMRPVAVEVELAKEAFRRMGYQAVFRNVSLDNRDELLEQGEVDCLWSCLMMEGKEKDYQWVGPYLYAGEVVVVRTDSDIRSLSQLAGKRIAVTAGSESEGYLLRKEYPSMPEIQTVYAFDHMTQAHTSLSKGYSDAVVGLEGEMLPLLESAPGEFQMLPETLAVHPLGIAFVKDYDASFVAVLREILEEMKLDGTTAGIIEKYGMSTEIAMGGK